MGEAEFASAEQAINVMWPAMARLAGLLAWGVIWLAHITAALLALAACWWAGVHPEQLARALRATSESTTIATLGALGLSGATGLAAWGWLMKQLQHWLVGRIALHAMPD
jgi:hypothetical protein